MSKRSHKKWQITPRQLWRLALLLAGMPWLTAADDLALNYFPATRLTIFSADGKQVIGHGLYSLSRNYDTDTLRGENFFLNGEHDVEVERIGVNAASRQLRLISYIHSFFYPDGSLRLESSLDTDRRVASCKRFVDQNLKTVVTTLVCPPDTYAGAAQIMFVVSRLRQGAQGIQFHSFGCLPEPRLISVEAIGGDQRVRWSMHPGELVNMQIRPTLGWLNAIIAPFVPTMYAWFDPDDGWNFVGGLYNRFYNGQRVLSVSAPVQ